MKRAFSRKNLWDKTPAPIKSVIGAALGVVPLPYLLGKDFRRRYRFACEADRWDAERSREYQLSELKRVLTLAYEKTEFYRESFRSVGFEPGDLKQPEDMQGLPTIDKTTIRENWQRMLTRPITDPDVDMVTTGGTSGEPLRFYMSSSRHAREFAHLCACWKRVGYRPGDTMAVLRGRVIRKRHNGMYHEYDPVLRHHYYSTFHMTPDDLSQYAHHIRSARPQFIHAYPSALFALSNHTLLHGVDISKCVQAALLESEPVHPHQRESIQRHLGVRVFSSYGLTEKVVLATECEHTEVYHVIPSYGYCEVVDANGTNVHDMQTGEITGTGFLDDITPLIRYRTGDCALLRANSCPCCRRHQMQLADLEPRRGQEALVCRDGRTLLSLSTLPITSTLCKMDYTRVLRWQFVQDKPGQAELHLFVQHGHGPFDITPLAWRLQEVMGHCLDLKICVAEHITLTHVGKQPMVIQRCAGRTGLLTGHRDDGARVAGERQTTRTVSAQERCAM